MLNLDLPKSLTPSDDLLAITTKPRHRYLLLAYSRHLYLEMSGRYDDVLADDMMVENPVHNLHALGFNTTITGKHNVSNLYKFWADTKQSGCYGENLQGRVADNLVE